MKNPVEQLAHYRKLSRRPLKRGVLPADQQAVLQRPKKDPAWGIVVGLTIFGAVIGAVWGGVHSHTVIGALEGMGLLAFIAPGGYALFPLLVGIRLAIAQRGWPNSDFVTQFRDGHVAFCLATLAALFALLSLPLTEMFWPLPDTAFPPPPATVPAVKPHSDDQFSFLFKLPDIQFPVIPWERWEALTLELGLSALAWLIGLTATYAVWRIQCRSTRGGNNPLGSPSGEHEFRLWIGSSTGSLARLGHRTNVAARQQVGLSAEDAAQNILILGGIGSGKTTRAVHPLLVQLLDQQCGGLIFDIKGDFHHAVRQFARLTHRSVVTFGPGHTPFNLLAGLTPEMAASFLKSVLLLASQHSNDQFWIHTATELCRNSLGMLALCPAHYSVQRLYQYVFDAEFREVVSEALEAQRTQLSDIEFRKLKACEEHQSVFDRFDDRIKSGVYATLSQVLSPFNHPELMDAFCTANPRPDAPTLSAVLTGSLFLVNLPLSVWGVGAKVVYTLLKLRFYNVMQQRTVHANGGVLSPVFFLCDEFQEIVSVNKDGLSDLNFWDKARSSKTIGIVSAQSLSSLYAALNNRDLADALCQNFRQKLCFRSEDSATLQYFQNLADKVEVSRRTHGQSSGTQSASGSGSAQTSRSQSENTSWTEKLVLSPQLFRQLSSDQVVALLSINGHSADDVLDVQPIYVSPAEVTTETAGTTG